MSEKTKVYTYTRVSTAIQVDGYSLDETKEKNFIKTLDFESTQSDIYIQYNKILGKNSKIIYIK